MKHGLREKNYARYMDDVVIIHHDKEHLHRIRRRVEAYLRDELRLALHRKTQVFPVAVRRGRSLDFLGYKIWVTHRRIRKQSIDRMIRRLRLLGHQFSRGQIGLKDIQRTVQSWVAHAGHAQTYGLRRKVLGFKFSKGERDGRRS